MKLGQTSYIGALQRARARSSDYVDFYAHLHRVVDEKIGRLLAALGDPADPASLRSRTVIVRTSDHGEMGLSHGGLRQKMFNAYEESIRVPLVVSSPALFPEPRESDALVSLVDVVPTLLGLAGAPAATRTRLRRPRPRPAAARRARTRVRDAVLFTYDDHQAGDGVPGGAGPAEPDPLRARPALEVRRLPRPDRRRRARVRALRPRGRPRRGAQPRRQAHGPRPDGARAGARRVRLHALLEQLCAATGTLTPRAAAAPPDAAARSALGALAAAARVLHARLGLADLRAAVGQRRLDLLQRAPRAGELLLGLRLGLLGAAQLLAPPRVLPGGRRPRALLLRPRALARAFDRARAGFAPGRASPRRARFPGPAPAPAAAITPGRRSRWPPARARRGPPAPPRAPRGSTVAACSVARTLSAVASPAPARAAASASTAARARSAGLAQRRRRRRPPAAPAGRPRAAARPPPARAPPRGPRGRRRSPPTPRASASPAAGPRRPRPGRPRPAAPWPARRAPGTNRSNGSRTARRRDRRRRAPPGPYPPPGGSWRPGFRDANAPETGRRGLRQPAGPAARRCDAGYAGGRGRADRLREAHVHHVPPARRAAARSATSTSPASTSTCSSRSPPTSCATWCARRASRPATCSARASPSTRELRLADRELDDEEAIAP